MHIAYICMLIWYFNIIKMQLVKCFVGCVKFIDNAPFCTSVQSQSAYIV